MIVYTHFFQHAYMGPFEAMFFRNLVRLLKNRFVHTLKMPFFLGLNGTTFQGIDDDQSI